MKYVGIDLGTTNSALAFVDPREAGEALDRIDLHLPRQATQFHAGHRRGEGLMHRAALG
mgnify:CR=1 FL=1